MARTTEGEVRTIIETDLLKLDSFVNTANRIVTDRLGNENIASATLADIEKWLAAHLICINGMDKDDRRNKNKTGLLATYYGQTASALDPSGKITNIGKSSAIFEVFKPTQLSTDEPE